MGLHPPSVTRCPQDPEAHRRYLEFRDARSSVPTLLLRAAMWVGRWRRGALRPHRSAVTPLTTPDVELGLGQPPSSTEFSLGLPLAQGGGPILHGTAECQDGERRSAVPRIESPVFTWLAAHPCSLARALYRGDAVIDISGILFTSKPVSATASRPVFQILGSLVGFFCLLRAIQSVASLAGQGTFSPAPTDFRLTAVGLRDGALPSYSANGFDFGLVRGGCILQQAGGVILRARGNGTVPATLSLPFPVQADGYYLSTPAGSSSADVVRWKLEACVRSEGQGCVWWVAGGSGRQGVGSVAMYSSAVDFPMPLERGEAAIVDHRPTWPDGVMDIGAYASVCVGWLAYALFGRWGRPELAKASMVCGFGATAVLSVVAGVGYAVMRSWFELGLTVLSIVSNGILAIVMLCCERYAIHAVAWFGALQMLKSVRWFCEPLLHILLIS
mmetsp:Transcript_76437/g.205796  ORF Transcript_76437/g.205796 Transcript_76437/m.205796 type:complete len:444 (-) Transcript_76437:1184-2515(-)